MHRCLHHHIREGCLVGKMFHLFHIHQIYYIQAFRLSFHLNFTDCIESEKRIVFLHHYHQQSPRLKLDYGFL